MNAASRMCARLLALLALASSPAVWAHAFLDHAEPRVGASVGHAPERVTLWFTQPLEAAFSWVKVYDSSGTQVDRGDKSLEGDASVMRVSVRALAPGKYRVAWRVLSTDAHVTEGDFTFEVKG
jgi:copper resistance protein C